MVNVAVVTVVAAIGSLKVAVIAAFTANPVALLAGLVDETVGGVVSGAVPPPPPPPPHDAMAMLKRIAKANLIVLIFISLGQVDPPHHDVVQGSWYVQSRLA